MIQGFISSPYIVNKLPSNAQTTNKAFDVQDKNVIFTGINTFES